MSVTMPRGIDMQGSRRVLLRGEGVRKVLRILAVEVAVSLRRMMFNRSPGRQTIKPKEMWVHTATSMMRGKI